jgi:hypothetical protein
MTQDRDCGTREIHSVRSQPPNRETGDSRVEETFELQKDDRKIVLDLKDVGVINRDANALFRGM